MRPTKKARTELPTKDEQKNLQQIESLMNSNLFNLQVSEILAQVDCVSSFQKKKVSTWLTALVSDVSVPQHIDNNPSIDEKWLSNQDLSGFQLSHFIKSTKVQFDFAPPVAVETVGSSVIKTATAPFLNIDVTVTMPPDIFETR